MGTTLSDLAKESGLDISTISRALREDPRVKIKTREKVQALADKMGYRPNLTARNLAAGSTRTIWLLLPSLPFQIESSLAQYAGPLMREHGYDLLIALFHGKEDVYAHLLKRLNQGVADGAILMPNNDKSTPEIKQLIKRKFPMVFIDRYIKNASIPVVTTDQINSSKTLVLKCMEQQVDGFIIYFDPINDVVKKRQKGAIDAVAKTKLPFLSVEHNNGIDLNKLKQCNRIGIIANSPHYIRAALKADIQSFKQKKIIFACYDTWQGDPYPGESVHVCHQDFRAMADVAVKEILRQVEEPNVPTRRRTFKIPAKKFERIDQAH
jgi:LacI family transcriptional regulator